MTIHALSLSTAYQHCAHCVPQFRVDPWNCCTLWPAYAFTPFCRYFLPPIIFYAGLSVKKKKFFRNFGSIATLGILGTYILFAVIALGLFAISKLPNLLNLTVRHDPYPKGSCLHLDMTRHTLWLQFAGVVSIADPMSLHAQQQTTPCRTAWRCAPHPRPSMRFRWLCC